jgi:hypothetical protein
MGIFHSQSLLTIVTICMEDKLHLSDLPLIKGEAAEDSVEGT